MKISLRHQDLRKCSQCRPDGCSESERHRYQLSLVSWQKDINKFIRREE